MSKMMVKRDGLWTPMANLKGDTGPLPADNSVTNDALVTDGAKTNTAYLMGNRLTATAEGEMISVDDSYPSAALSLTVDGKSTQVTTTGKNLCPHKRSQWTYMRLSKVGEGKVVSSGGTGHYCVVVPLEEGQSITWHRNYLASSPGYFRICSDYPPIVGTTISGGVTLTNYTTLTLTNNDGTKPCAMLFATGNGMPTDRELEIMQAQLEYGTSFTSYEPYSGGVSSPSPEWSQNITSIDSADISVYGRNLIDGSVSAWESGAMSSSGTETTNSTRIRMTGYMPLPNGTYTLSVADGWTVNAINIFDKNKNFITRFLAIDRNVSTFYMSSAGLWDGAYIRVFFGKADNSDITPEDVLDAKPMLVPGSVAADYEPYSGDVAQLQDITLRSLPDGTKDELYLTYLRPSSRAGWAWYEPTLTQRVGLLNLDGSKSYESEGGRYYLQVDDMKRLANYAESMLCDHLKVYSKQGDIGGVINFVSGISGYARAETYHPGKNWIYIAIEKGMTAADTKQWVSEHPMLVTYLLATPITTQLDPIELPIMQAGITNLWSDPSTNLSVIYERDRNIVITNLKAAVADLITS